MFVYRELNLKSIYHCLLIAARTSAVVLILVAMAMVASYMITIADVPGQIGAWLEPIADSPGMLVAAMLLIAFGLGMVLDFIPIVLVLTPVFMPIIRAAGVDPVYFGVVFIMTVAIGMITPPVGVVLNVIASIGKVSMERAVRGVLPFLAAEALIVILLLLFPAFVTVPAGWWR